MKQSEFESNGKFTDNLQTKTLTGMNLVHFRLNLHPLLLTLVDKGRTFYLFWWPLKNGQCYFLGLTTYFSTSFLVSFIYLILTCNVSSMSRLVMFFFFVLTWKWVYPWKTLLILHFDTRPGKRKTVPMSDQRKYAWKLWIGFSSAVRPVSFFINRVASDGFFHTSLWIVAIKLICNISFYLCWFCF